MSRRLSLAALALYPLAHRRRYGAEMEALVEDSPAGPREVADLVRGALLAHLRPAPGLVLGAEDRLRAGAAGLLACWILFAAAGFGFYKTTEDGSFATAAAAHPLLGAVHTAVQALAAIGSLAVVLGAAPLVLGVLREAPRNRRARAAALGAGAAVASFVLATAGLVALAANQGAATDLGRALFVAWLGLGLACGICCLLAARAGLFALAAERRPLRAAIACGAVVEAAMVAIALLTVLCALALFLDAPHLAAAPNGPFGLVGVGASVALQAAAMVAAAGLGALTLRRALPAWRRSAAA